MRLFPTQRTIADSMGDPLVERVSVLKGVRVGYSQLLAAAIGHWAVNDPSLVLMVLPADDDCRTVMTTLVEPTFAESPSLRAALTADTNDRDTLYQRHFPGGTLTLVSARAPRNLRGRTAKVLLLDEVDGFEIDVRGEGDPVRLAENRTLSFGNRKIVMGSTPVDEETSRILAAYERSDKRVYECPCPACDEFQEVAWKDIRWPEGRPEAAHWVCPSCGGVIEESGKAAFVMAGRWRATAPEIRGHHGYRLNCLVSLSPNAAWGRLAAEFLEAKRGGPHTLKAWTTTILAEPWRAEGETLDEAALLSRREPFDLEDIPAEVLSLTVGIDTGGDRVELATVGWTRDDTAIVLGHEIIWGSPLDNETWEDVDSLLKRRFPHKGGGQLHYDAVIVDSGGEDGATDKVYQFCKARVGRRVFAGKGASGFQRPAVELSTKRDVRLQIVGVDGLKSQILTRLQAGSSIRFSHTLDANWFEQLTAERRVVRMLKGHPIRGFERIPGRRAEALDCTVYAFAAKHLVVLNLDRREEELASVRMLEPAIPSVIRSAWLHPEGN